ncbi:MAG: hypothetical protein HY608_04490 [Planctomycetes bacterium]|nr:hypothetical protein [Planctomycetota bacterium]
MTVARPGIDRANAAYAPCNAERILAPSGSSGEISREASQTTWAFQLRSREEEPSPDRSG